MAKRSGLLVVAISLAMTLAACGRASPARIDAVLGITPTATQSVAQIATATAVVVARQTALAASSGGSPGAVAVTGDVALGQSLYNQWCLNCHRAGGTGPNLLAAGGPGASLNYPALLDLIRQGTNHAKPAGPGPYQSFILTDRAVANILAYIVASATS